MSVWIFNIDLERGAERFWRFVDALRVKELVTGLPSASDEIPTQRLEDLTQVIEDKNLRHGHEPTDKPEDGGQVVRDPDEVFKHSEATCIEIVAIMAGACLKAGIRPWAVFGRTLPPPEPGKGHAWLVVEVESEPFTTVRSGDKRVCYTNEFESWERKRIAQIQRRERIEDVHALQQRLRENPDRYLVVDAARLLRGYEDSVVNGAIRRNDPEALFDSYNELWCCDIGWWWSSEWIHLRPGEFENLRPGINTSAAGLPTSPGIRVGVESRGPGVPEAREPAGTSGHPLASIRTREGRHLSAIRGAVGLELQEGAEGGNGPSVTVSPDGRIVATVVGAKIEVATVNRLTAELKLWQTRELSGCGESARVLAISRRGTRGVLAVVSDTTSTWLVELDPSGSARFERIDTKPAIAATIVRGAPWVLTDGKLNTPMDRHFPPAGTILDLDAAGGIGSEIFALLLSGDEGTKVDVIRDLVNKQPSTISMYVPNGTTKISLVRELGTDVSLAPNRMPRSLRYGTHDALLTWDWETPTSVDGTTRPAVGADNGP